MSATAPAISRGLLPLALAMFVGSLGSAVIPGVLPHLVAGSDLTLAQIGFSNGLFGLSYAIAAPLIALVARRFDPLRVLKIALVGYAMVMVLVAVSDNATMLYGSRVLHAIVAAGTIPSCTVIAGTMVSPRYRSRALSFVFTGMVVSTLIGAPLGNTLAPVLSPAGVFLLVSGCALAALTAVMLSVRSIGLIRSQTAAADTAAGGRTATAILGSAAVVVLGATLATAFLESSGTSAMSTYLSPFLTEQLGVQGGGLSLMLLCYGVAGILGNWVFGAVADRIGAARTLIGLEVAATVGIVALSMSTSVPLTVLVLGAWGFCSWAINPALQSLILAHGGQHLTLLVAVNSSVIYLGMGAGNALAGSVVDGVGVMGVPTLAAGLLALSVMTAIVVAIAQRQARRVAEGGLDAPERATDPAGAVARVPSAAAPQSDASVRIVEQQ